MGIVAGTVHFGAFDWTGNFTSLELLAAAMSALNGALLCRRPDHFKRITVVGVLLMALLGGIGGGITRDVLVSDVPVALTNPAYITVCLVAGMVGYRITYARGQLFREGLFELVTSFSLILYAIVGAQKGVNSDLPVLGCVFLAAVTATAGRFYVDLSSGVTPKHFVRGEWFVSVAVLTGIVWIALFALGLNTWICAGVAGATGYAVRVLAMYRGWEEPLAQGPKGVYVHEDRPLLGSKIKANPRASCALSACGWTKRSPIADGHSSAAAVHSAFSPLTSHRRDAPNRCREPPGSCPRGDGHRGRASPSCRAGSRRLQVRASSFSPAVPPACHKQR